MRGLDPENTGVQKGSRGEVKGGNNEAKADSESPQKRQEALRQSIPFTYSVEDKADDERKPRNAIASAETRIGR